MLFLEAVLAVRVATGEAGVAMFLILVLPRLVLTAGAFAVVVAVAQRRAVAVGAAATVAVVVTAFAAGSVIDGLVSAFAAMLAIALAAVVLATSRSRSLSTPTGLASVLASWWTAGAALAGLVGLAYGGLSGPGTAGGGIIFLLLAGAGGACAVGLRSARPVAAWVLAATWPVTLVAVSLSDADGLGLGAVLVLHAAAALAAVGSAPIMAALGPAAVAARGRAVVTAARVPRAWLLWGGLALAVATGLLLAVSGSSSASGASGAGVGTMVIVVGFLALAAIFTPTLPWFWRVAAAAGGALAIAAGWTGFGSSSSGDALLWVVLVPLALVGTCAWGALVNHRHGTTSSRPGWAGPGTPPPPRSVSFLIPPTAGARSRLALHVETALPPDAALEAVRRATAVRGNWFVVFDDHVEIAGTDDHVVGLHIGGHCHFRARVETRGSRTVLRVGGMDRYLQSRSWYGFIPAGPAHVQGFWMYRLFLQTVAAELARLDTHARLSIAGPSQAVVA
ncbi:hypothetical protein ACR9E3_16745 [Actinomycetospora sp. C-140]